MAKGRMPFPGGMGGGNMAAMMKRAQQMQEKMLKTQAALEEATYEASAGGGMVKVAISGKKQVLSIDIADEMLNPEEKDMLIDMLTVAFNDCSTQVDEKAKEELGPLAGSLGL